MSASRDSRVRGRGGVYGLDALHQDRAVVEALCHSVCQVDTPSPPHAGRGPDETPRSGSGQRTEPSDFLPEPRPPRQLNRTSLLSLSMNVRPMCRLACENSNLVPDDRSGVPVHPCFLGQWHSPVLFTERGCVLPRRQAQIQGQALRSGTDHGTVSGSVVVLVSCSRWIFQK